MAPPPLQAPAKYNKPNKKPSMKQLGYDNFRQYLCRAELRSPIP
jgi:hypothetical protein